MVGSLQNQDINFVEMYKVYVLVEMLMIKKDDKDKESLFEANYVATKFSFNI